MLNTFRQVGGSFGIAIMGAILTNRSSTELAGGATRVDAFISGLHESLYVGAAIAFTAATVAASSSAATPSAAASVRPFEGGDRVKPAQERGVTARGRERHAVRLSAAERRGRSSTLRFAFSRKGATRVRRPPRSRGRRGSRSRSSIGISAPRRSCTSRAWTCVERPAQLLADQDGRVGPVEAWRELGPSTMRRLKAVVPSLWMQAITEAGEDPEIRRFVRKHMREVHDFFAETLRRLQEAGAIPADRDPNAEAWIFLGGSLLASFGDRLGGLLSDDDFNAIKAQRWRWLSGAG